MKTTSAGGALGLAAIVFAAGFALPARADDASALLAKHKAYVGWQAGDGAIATLRESGAVTFDGHVRHTIEALHRGFIYRERYGQFQEGFTGRVLWTSNENGFTVRSIGEPAQFTATYQAFFCEGLDGAPARVERTEVLQGTPVTWVRVQPQIGVAADLAVDPATGAFKRVVFDPSGKYETAIDILSYADAGDGKRVVSSWRYVGGKSIWTYTDIKANAPVSDAELHPPAQRATWSFDPAGGTIPVELTDTRIFVDASVNGVKGRFIFDTGADGIAMTDSFARRAAAKRRGETQIEGIGGGATANTYVADTVAFGNNVLHNVIVTTGLDERDPEWNDVAGLIGFDLLGGAIVDLNLDAKTLRIMDPQKVEPDKSKGFVVPVDLTTGTPRVPMSVAGRIPVLATLDTGSSAWVLFSKSLESRDHVKFFVDASSLGSELQFYGVNGTETDRCGKLESLILGPIRYAPVPACASDSMRRSEVLVGLEFVRAFNTIFDYPDGYLLMTPRK